MKNKIALSVLLLFISTTCLIAQVGIGTTEPKAMLDIQSSDSGILIPRVALTAANLQAPITAPTVETGLLVFNTATSGTAPNNVTPGFYYWNGSKWTGLTSKITHGGNIQSVIGTSDAVKNPGTGFTDFDDITITFTPVNPIVYVTFSAAGHASTASRNSYIDFRLVNITAGNTVLAGTNSLSTDTNTTSGGQSSTSIVTSWNSSINMFPVAVTPGVPTTLKIQWNIGGVVPQTHFCSVSSLPDSSHRVLTILD